MSKTIFWVTIIISAIRDGITDVSNTDVSLFLAAGMITAIAAELIFGGDNE